MDWLLTNPQIHSTFASLGSMQGETYVPSENCVEILNEINRKLLVEDHTLRTFRRAIGYLQNVKNDLIPLLIFAKSSKIIDATIRIFVNLTIPVECLLNIDVMTRTGTGRHTIFEINKLLITCKEAFTDSRTTKAIVDYIKTVLEKDIKLSSDDCDIVNNCLLLLRNILHIPEGNILNYHVSGVTTMQNKLIWNLFTQSIDKLLIHLMSSSEKSYWGVTMVQLIALMYKDQHVNTLQKLLSFWFEASFTESSEDNESNTSPPKQSSGDSSPMLTSDPTSDSSDNGSSVMIGKGNTNSERMSVQMTSKDSEISFQSRKNLEFQTPPIRVKHSSSSSTSLSNNNKHQSSKERELNSNDSSKKQQQQPTQSKVNNFNSNQKLHSGQKREWPSSQSELSDCGYGTQVENQESISTSSNEDDNYNKKPIHHPPCNQKQRYNSGRNNITISDKKEIRRKKLIKRSRSTLINMKGLLHHTPTDEDISNILKEFTVDFLLKGYGNLVHELHEQLLTDLHVQIDTSHFFWLVTYFLKFAAQLELELEHINFVLSYDVVSYLTYEGVTLCEQLEMARHNQESDLKPCLRRMHLVVTAIREFIQALETYTKITHLSPDDRLYLRNLQCHIGATEELRCLFILLLRKFDPLIQSKQYLQDLIVTNHMLLLFLDNETKFPEFNGQTRMMEHIKQFATVEIMHQYGLLLENFRDNSEFVNDCILTMMHHIGGDLGQCSILFQPNILKTYSLIWENEYELCDDWSDLIEYVIHKFINTPQQNSLSLPSPSYNLNESNNSGTLIDINIHNWTQEEMDNLYWYYVQSKKSKDVIGKIIKLFRQNGNNEIKSRLAIIQQLLQQDIITLFEYDELMKYEDKNFERSIITLNDSTLNDNESGIEMKDSVDDLVNKSNDDIQILRDRLLKENKGGLLLWLQKVLIESCFIKLVFNSEKSSIHLCGIFENNILEPVEHHSIIKKQSIPVIPWNTEQSNILIYQPFVLLLHKLGFHLPADAGKLFVRIPEFWTADIMYNVALKLGPIDKSTLKFDETKLKCPQGFVSSKTITKTTNKNECFVLPRSVNSNKSNRYTPDSGVTTISSQPDWLQIIMKNKTIPENSKIFEEHLYTSGIQHLIRTATSSINTNIMQTTSTSIINSTLIHSNLVMIKNDVINSTSTDDIIMKQVSLCKTTNEIKTKNIEPESNNTVNVINNWNSEEHEITSNCETASIASYLTRMYVSDEDDKVGDENLQ